MAKFRVKKNKNGEIKGWQSETTFCGKVVTILFSKSQFKESAARQRHDVVQDLEKSSRLGLDPNPATLKMLEALPDLTAILKEKGVLNCGVCLTLGELCDRYIKQAEEQAQEPGTIANKRARVKRLFEFFDAKTKVDEFTKDDAQRYDAFLNRQIQAGTLAPATRSDFIKKTKAIFNLAVEMDLIEKNPFKSIKAGKQSNRARMFYVTESETKRILEACEYMNNGAEWAVITALARFQGLRVPSEPRALKWEDVDFIGGKFMKTKNGDPIRALKITAQKQKKTDRAIRIMPLFSRAAEILERLRDEQERAGTLDDSPFVLRHVRMVTNPGTTFKKIVFRAGVEDYPKPFQNLRASAASDVRRKYGRAAESDWIGHDAAIADEHYDMVTDDILLEAAGLTPELEEKLFK